MGMHQLSPPAREPILRDCTTLPRQFARPHFLKPSKRVSVLSLVSLSCVSSTVRITGV